jgi:hypothetical protein
VCVFVCSCDDYWQIVCDCRAGATTMMRVSHIIVSTQYPRRRRHQPQKAQKPDDTSVVFDFFYPDVDICYDEASGEFGKCDSTRFPTCSDGELICYNRRPFRNRFYADTRQPLFYIDYKSVLCYPNSWQGCSSCSPGRYCKSEQRCILQDVDYPCEKWF